MSSYFSIGRQPGFLGNSVYFPADHPTMGTESSDTNSGEHVEVQNHERSNVTGAAGGDMPGAFPRIGGFEYLNPRGAGTLGGFQNYLHKNVYTSFMRDSPASTYGAYSTFRPETVFNRNSNVAPQNNEFVSQPPTHTFKESRWGMPTKMFNDSSYALGALINNAQELECERIKHWEKMNRLQKDADFLRAQEEEESLLTAMDKMSVTNETITPVHGQQKPSTQKHVQITAADFIGRDKGCAVSDSVYISLPNMHNAFTQNAGQQTCQPVHTKYVLESAPKVETPETAQSGNPALVVKFIPSEGITDTDTAIETQSPKVFADSIYAFDIETENSAEKTASEHADEQSNEEEQLVTVSPITDSIILRMATGVPEKKTSYVTSDYNFEELRGLVAFGAR